MVNFENPKPSSCEVEFQGSNDNDDTGVPSPIIVDAQRQARIRKKVCRSLIVCMGI